MVPCRRCRRILLPIATLLAMSVPASAGNFFRLLMGINQRRHAPAVCFVQLFRPNLGGVSSHPREYPDRLLAITARVVQHGKTSTTKPIASQRYVSTTRFQFSPYGEASTACGLTSVRLFEQILRGRRHAGGRCSSGATAAKMVVLPLRIYQAGSGYRYFDSDDDIIGAASSSPR